MRSTNVHVGLLSIASMVCGLSLRHDVTSQPVRGLRQGSPLNVQLQNSTHDGMVRAVITNQGSLPMYFLASRSPLSTDLLERKLDVFTAEDKVAQFLNSEGFPESIPSATEAYTRIEAGSSVAREIDIASNYDIQTEQTYGVKAGGVIPFFAEGQGIEDVQYASYESNVVFLTTAFTSRRPAETSSLETSSKYILNKCSNAGLMEKIKTSLPIAHEMAVKASEATAAGKNKEAFLAYFKVDSPDTRKKVANRYAAMAKALSKPGEGPTKIACLDSCTGRMAGGAAWTGVTGGLTQFCPTVSIQ
jgi:hypothetical protein